MKIAVVRKPSGEIILQESDRQEYVCIKELGGDNIFLGWMVIKENSPTGDLSAQWEKEHPKRISHNGAEYIRKDIAE